MDTLNTLPVIIVIWTVHDLCLQLLHSCSWTIHVSSDPCHCIWKRPSHNNRLWLLSSVIELLLFTSIFYLEVNFEHLQTFVIFILDIFCLSIFCLEWIFDLHSNFIILFLNWPIVFAAENNDFVLWNFDPLIPVQITWNWTMQLYIFGSNSICFASLLKLWQFIFNAELHHLYQIFASFELWAVAYPLLKYACFQNYFMWMVPSWKFGGNGCGLVFAMQFGRSSLHQRPGQFFLQDMDIWCSNRIARHGIFDERTLWRGYGLCGVYFTSFTWTLKYCIYSAFKLSWTLFNTTCNIVVFRFEDESYIKGGVIVTT